MTETIRFVLFTKTLNECSIRSVDHDYLIGDAMWIYQSVHGSCLHFPRLLVAAQQGLSLGVRVKKLPCQWWI